MWLDLYYHIGEQIGQVVSGIVGVIAYGLTHWVAKWWKSRKRSEPVQSVRRDIETHKLLREIRIEMKAERAFLAQFTNGKAYVGGHGEYRYSWTHEDCATPGAGVADWFDNIPTTLVPYEMELVEEPGPSFRLVNDLPEGRFKNNCISAGAVAVVRCAVCDRGHIIGFIGVDYAARSAHMSASLPTNMHSLVAFSSRMERLISGRDQY